ncbi:MRP-L47-domain-containing protein [Calocera cornea HHB12733]|uniref:Large ribosomal subunit protein uL29m n=1 Tax=Calocera cornea HHB12733 TaxID=1353952 RepID=A0A165F853_9BASI|nr:MRP-L47-domain-containing protein [Calocera cornea HHB12733]
MAFLRRLPTLLPYLPSTSSLLLARPLPPTLSRSLPRLPLLSRTYAAVPHPSTYASPAPPPKRPPPNADGTLRPHLGVETRPDHGLYGFFHRDSEGKAVTLEMQDVRTDFSGRSWNAPELRRKSFLDLHTLWYVLIRERNVLHTQLEEWKKVGGMPEHFSNIEKLNKRCRKSLARIKYVLNERRLAFKHARLIEMRVAKNNVRNQARLARKAKRLEEEAATAAAGGAGRAGAGAGVQQPQAAV